MLVVRGLIICEMKLAWMRLCVGNERLELILCHTSILSAALKRNAFLTCNEPHFSRKYPCGLTDYHQHSTTTLACLGHWFQCIVCEEMLSGI